MPKEISLSINKHRGKWTINAMPIGGKQRVGRFEKWDDAKAEADLDGLASHPRHCRSTKEREDQRRCRDRDVPATRTMAALPGRRDICESATTSIGSSRLHRTPAHRWRGVWPARLEAVFRSDVKDDLETLIVNHLKAMDRITRRPASNPGSSTPNICWPTARAVAGSRRIRWPVPSSSSIRRRSKTRSLRSCSLMSSRRSSPSWTRRA